MKRAADEQGLDVLDDGTPPRHKRRRGPMFALLMACIGVLVLALGVAGYYAVRGLSALDSIDRDQQLTPQDYEGRPEAATPAPAASGEAQTAAPLNFVLMASDSRGDIEEGRSDSLMIAHVTGDRQAVYLVSFPRDMWVDIPGHGKGKINWAYSFGGPQLTVRTLEQLTGVRMDHTVLIDFEGFIQLVDSVGGINVYNPWATEQNPGTRFEEGEIHLDGERALIYVRERYPLPNGDLDRAYRQRTVVKAIIREIMTPATLANPVTFSNVVGQMADTMTVDDGMTNQFVTDLALSMRLTGTGSIGMLQAPVSGTGMVGSQSVVVVDDDGLAELSRALAEDTMDEYHAANLDGSLGEVAEVDPEE
ncbi:LCP family protein [Tessaracoccus sp. MC1679]|uniref:LCP family protein n=1 Tax=Tessaracoccus sp. MC1679 TaxID=2760313 RepID=UPI001601FCBE|nr:LCP family protein [Tessaracoccus sp. MC1679]MBB1515357.1 LCP family protein [Tessaracoccus sp. MC1679]